MRCRVVLVGLGLILSACGGGDSSSPPSSSTTSTTTTSPSATTTAPPTTSTSTTTTTSTTTVAPVPPTIDEVLALGRPIVIGHAGGDRSWPHSTMFAFGEAVKAGVDVLEMDVQLTADGVLVVQHDDTIDRTTESTGRVRDLTYDELHTFDNGYWWSDNWSSHDEPESAYVYRGIRTGDQEPPEGYTADDFQVETFRAIAEAFPGHLLDIEIKVPRDSEGEDDIGFAIEGAEVLAREIVELGRSESVIVVSFNTDVIQAFREIAPDVATSPAEDEMFAWYLGAAELASSIRVAQVPPTFGDIDVLAADIVERIHAEGQQIWVWPNAGDQENADYYVEAIERGADGIIAGHPDLAVERFYAEGLID